MRLLPFYFILFASCFVYSQSSEVQSWQEDHPNVVFVDSRDLTEEFQLILEKSRTEYIVFNDQISMSDIEGYEALQTLDQDGSSIEIKKWLADHQDVKIISRSYFNSLSEDRRQVYIDNQVMILIGEVVTLKDIEDYEAH